MRGVIVGMLLLVVVVGSAIAEGNDMAQQSTDAAAVAELRRQLA